MLGRPAPLEALLDGTTRAEVERRGGVSPMTLSRWRRGIGWPQFAAIRRLAKALGRDTREVEDAVLTMIATARARREGQGPR